MPQPPQLRAGDLHSSLGGLSLGDDHPQYLNRFLGGAVAGPLDLGGPLTLGCPVTLIQGDVACDPIFTIYSYDSLIQPFIQVRRTPNRELFVEGSVLPGFDFSGPGTPLYNNGDDDYYWRSTRARTNIMQQRRLVPISRTLPAGAQLDDYNIFANGEATVMRLTAVQDVVITGIARPALSGSQAGAELDIINIETGFSITLNNLDGASAADNQIITGLPGGNPVVLNDSDTSRIWYDDVSNKWRILK